MNSLAKNSVYNVIYKLLNLVLPLISSVYVAHVLMPEGVGRVAYAQNISSYFVMFAALGIPTLGVRVIAVARNDRERLDKSFSELIILNAVFTTVMLIAYVLLVYLNQTFRSEYLLFAAVGLTVAFNYINIDWFYQGCEEYKYIVIRSIVIKILSIVALFVFVKKPNDYVIYALISSLATCGNYIFNMVHARKYVSLRFSGLDLKKHLKPIFTLAVSLLCASIYSKIDIAMLGAMAGDESVGYYSYAHKIADIAIGLCVAVTATFLPRLSYYYKNAIEQFYKLISKGVQIIAFLAFPAAVGMFLLAEEAIVLLFGSEFSPAAQTLQYFSVLILIFSFGNLLCYQVIISSGKEKIMLPVLATAALINVCLNTILIPKYQHNGAVVASIFTELFINIAEFIYVRKYLKLKIELVAIAQAVLGSILMGACVVLVKHLVLGTVLTLICGVIAGIVTYICVNIVLKNKLLKEALFVLKKKIG